MAIEQRGPALRGARRRDRPGPAVHAGLRHRPRSRSRNLHQVDFYTSHEALILGYEEALTRQDSLTGDWYDCSAHMLWIGERTRQLDGAHVEFLRGVGNPLGCKLGPTATPDEVLALCEALNPDRVPGRLTLISRMGADARRGRPAARCSPPSATPATRSCGPATRCTATPSPADGGRKTRHFDDVLAEIAGFFAAHRAEGTWPGGVHVELTGDDVTECLGGAEEILDADLDDRYETMCDPRLNGRQSLDLAFRVAELLRALIATNPGPSGMLTGVSRVSVALQCPHPELPP